MASAALAAAEVLAAMLGKPMESPPESLQDWLRQGHSIDRGQVRAVLRAVERVRANSELCELWDEAGADEWLACLKDLEVRLQAVGR